MHFVEKNVRLIDILYILASPTPKTVLMKKYATPTGGFYMETEPLYPKQKGFNPVVLRNEKGVIYMRAAKDTSQKENQRDIVKVIAI